MVCTEDQKSGIELWHTVIIVSGAMESVHALLVWTNMHILSTHATHLASVHIQHSTLPMYKSTNILSMSSSDVVSLLLGQ